MVVLRTGHLLNFYPVRSSRFFISPDKCGIPFNIYRLFRLRKHKLHSRTDMLRIFKILRMPSVQKLVIRIKPFPAELVLLHEPFFMRNTTVAHLPGFFRRVRRALSPQRRKPRVSAFGFRAARIPCLPVSPQQQRLDLPVRETVIRKALESVKKHLHFLKKFSPPRRTHRKLPALLQNSAHSLLAPHQRHVVLRKPLRHILLVLTVELPPVMPAELRTLRKILFRRRTPPFRRVKIKSVPRVHCLDLLVHLPVKPVQNRVLPRFTEHRVKPLVYSHLVQKQIRNLRRTHTVRVHHHRIRLRIVERADFLRVPSRLHRRDFRRPARPHVHFVPRSGLRHRVRRVLRIVRQRSPELIILTRRIRALLRRHLRVPLHRRFRIRPPPGFLFNGDILRKPQRLIQIPRFQRRLDMPQFRCLNFG